MKKFKKYPNLRYDNKFIYSFGIKVAEIKGQTLIKSFFLSSTTSKHINYAGKELGLKVL